MQLRRENIASVFKKDSGDAATTSNGSADPVEPLVEEPNHERVIGEITNPMPTRIFSLKLMKMI
jgi:hypothetical protein